MDPQLSRSAKKRRAKGIEQLVHELAALPLAEIALLPCTAEIRQEIAAAKKLKGGARKRQLKYATRLLRDTPVAELFDFLAAKKGSQLKEKREFQQLENFRNLLLTEAVALYEEEAGGSTFIRDDEPGEILADSEVIRAIVDYLPAVDAAQLKKTAEQFARTRNRKFSRELFRIMKAAVVKAQFSQKQGTGNGI